MTTWCASGALLPKNTKVWRPAKSCSFCARGGGGYAPGEANHDKNFQDPYFKVIFGMIGITDISYIYDEKTLTGEDNLPAFKQQARELAQTVA